MISNDFKKLKLPIKWVRSIRRTDSMKTIEIIDVNDDCSELEEK